MAKTTKPQPLVFLPPTLRGLVWPMAPTYAASEVRVG